METHSISSAVRRVLSTVLKQDLTTMASVSRSDLPAWDSLKHVQVIFAIEDEFGVEFSSEELPSLDSDAKIVAAIEARHAS
jgi:acyl carrier protein